MVARDITKCKHGRPPGRQSRFHVIFKRLALLSPEGVILEINQRALSLPGLAGMNPGARILHVSFGSPSQLEQTGDAMGLVTRDQGLICFALAIAEAAAGELWCVA